MLAEDIMTESINTKVIVTLCVLFTFCSLAQADYEIRWYSIDTGGGTSRGGPYTLTGAVGQHDTGVSSGNEYVLSGGYWPGTFGCIVNLTDLMVFVDQWLATGDWPADFDDSGSVDFGDFATFSLWWYDSCPADWQLK